MHTMWWKLLLLTLYLVALFLLSRLLETVAYYEGGYLASRLLDPVSMSVRKLKTLLDQRGVSYAGVVEKKELTDLVDASGEVTEGELDAASLAAESPASTNFTCGGHFYEEVEDTKDSVWVVMVIQDRQRLFMARNDWETLTRKMSRFGVRMGVFDCRLDRRLCERKNWYTPRLVMALPQGYKAKDNVTLLNYSGSSRTQAILDWINFNLASRIKSIYSVSEINNDWFTFRNRTDNIKEQNNLRVIFISKSKIPPMFYSVLSVKFTGRVKFGVISAASLVGQRILNETGWTPRIPSYVVLTPERNYTFGLATGEYLNYDSMALFLKTLQPEVNDIFLLSLIVVNMMCWFELVWARGTLLKRVGRLLWHVGKWNCLLILLWLPVLGLFQLPYVDQVLSGLLALLRQLATTGPACWLRADWLCYSSAHCTLPLVAFLTYAALVRLIYSLWQAAHGANVTGEEDNDGTSGGGATSEYSTWWGTLRWEAYTNLFFQPFRERSLLEADVDVGIELLIERLAVPNFWLRPMISSQYLQDLPVWHYSGPSIDSDVGSDLECPSPRRVDSDGEEAYSGSELSGESRSRSMSQDSLPTQQQQPLIFVCEKCRALQSHNGNNGKTKEQLEKERMESESACAKYVMDGNYKCMCQSDPGGTGSRHGHRHSAGHSSRSGHRRHAERGEWTRGRRSPGGSEPRVGLDQGNNVPQAAGSDGANEEEHSRINAATGHDVGGKLSGGEGQEADVPAPAQSPPGVLPSTECAICLESYKFWVLLCGLPCGHAFHQQCIMGWLSRDNHQCPVCRWPAFKAKPCRMHQHAD